MVRVKFIRSFPSGNVTPDGEILQIKEAEASELAEFGARNGEQMDKIIKKNRYKITCVPYTAHIKACLIRPSCQCCTAITAPQA